MNSTESTELYPTSIRIARSHLPNAVWRWLAFVDWEEGYAEGGGETPQLALADLESRLRGRQQAQTAMTDE